MGKVIIATRYEYDLIDRPGVDFNPKNPLSRSKTLQSGKDEADINKIMERYEKTGCLGTPLDDISGRMPQFGDFSNVGDYHSVMCKVAAAQSNFMLLPASVRAKFEHDVGKLLAFVADDANYAEAVKLGILVADPVKDKAIAEAVNAAGIAAAAAKAAAEPPAPVAPDKGDGGAK